MAEAAALTLPEQGGQLIMVGVTPGALDVALLTQHHVGSIILMGSWTSSTSVLAATRAMAGVEGPVPLLIAADQEGGKVQRLKGTGFSTIPTAVSQAKMTDAALEAAATTWGEQLRAAGVHLDLAPVADVVPAAVGKRNAPIAALLRGYGSDPAVVSAKVSAFIRGMRAGGVATSVKHFPGLGTVTGNTDFATKVVDTTTTPDSSLLEPFKAAVAAQAGSVMVSTAYYNKIDPANPAAFSATVIDLLRSTVGFRGVVITDDLGVAKAVASVPASQRLLRAIEAGNDVAITTNAALAPAMLDGLLAEAAASPALAAKIQAAAARVLTLKASLGLTECAA